MGKLPISWENSAQGKRARPNPFLKNAIERLRDVAPSTLPLSRLHIADQGCGKLRHLSIFRRYFRTILMVDTGFQLTRTQRIGDKRTTILNYVEQIDRGQNRYRTITSSEFAFSNSGLDIVFCVCVLDVVPRSVRIEIIRAAHSNLRVGGYYCIVIPRNDQSITSRFTNAAAYGDGFLFKRDSVNTFFANFSADSRPLQHLYRTLLRSGFSIVTEISSYRQLCLICMANKVSGQPR